MFCKEQILEKFNCMSSQSEVHDLYLPEFNKIFSVNQEYDHIPSANKSWELSFEYCQIFWKDFKLWFEKYNYYDNFNKILIKLIREEEKLISKRRRLKKYQKTKIHYLHDYAKNKLKDINKKNMDDYFKMRLIKELGQIKINKNPDLLDKFMKRIQSWLKGITSFLSEIDDDLHKKIFASYDIDLKPPYYFEFCNNENEFNWISEKIKHVCDILPNKILLEEGLQKITRVMVAHVIFVLNSLDESLTLSEIDKVIFQAIQSGFYYGFSYPLIDDISDSLEYLDDSMRKKMEYLITKGLSGSSIEKSIIPENDIAYTILSIFDNLQKLYPREENIFLWDSFFVLYQAQIKDRKDINKKYSDDEVYIPIILKAAFSRIIAGAFTRNISIDFVQNTFLTALIAQLTDDLRDYEHDKKLKQFTPFTWKSKTHENYNPFDVYIAAAVYLNIYHGKESSASESSIYVMITGFMNLYKEKSEKEFNLYLDRLKIKDHQTRLNLIKLIKLRLYRYDPELSIRKNLKHTGLLIKERHHLKKIKTYIKIKKPFIEKVLPIVEKDNILPKNKKLIEAMNYSVKAGGKRVRPILALMTADYYKIENSRIIPLLRSLEYLHSASLILDDLPAQDDALLRRGQPTNHLKYGESTAQLASVSLISLAFNQIGELKTFSSDLINNVTQYASNVIGHCGISAGQYIDLQGKIENIEQLKQLSYLKTGLGIEACICIVAMLAEAPADDIIKWKLFAKNLGILYQIKDDILDVEGDKQILGKNTGIDQSNNTTTFVSMLGLHSTHLLLEEIWLDSIEVLDFFEKQGKDVKLFKGITDFIFFRNK